jgi:O-antigen/teichoic acid export membrane protein
MCRRFKGHSESLKRITETLLALLLAIALPAAVGLFLLSDAALQVVYGPEFLPASPALRIMTWTVISNAMTSALGQVLLASHKEGTSLRITMINAALNLVFGAVLVTQFGIIGAATTGLIVTTVNLIQHYVPVSKLLSGIAVRRFAWPSLVATGFMGVYVNAVAGYNLFVIIGSAAIFYALILAALTVFSLGGFGRFREQYRFLVSS